MQCGIVLFRADTVVFTSVVQVKVLKFYPAIRGTVSIVSSSQTSLPNVSSGCARHMNMVATQFRQGEF